MPSDFNLKPLKTYRSIMENETNKKTITLPNKLEQFLRATDKDRGSLAGINCKHNADSTLEFAATNGHWLALASNVPADVAVCPDCVIKWDNAPKSPIKQSYNCYMYDESGNDIKDCGKAGKLTLDTDSQFPDYKLILPTTNPEYKISFSAKYMQEICSLFLAGKLKNDIGNTYLNLAFHGFNGPIVITEEQRQEQLKDISVILMPMNPNFKE